MLSCANMPSIAYMRCEMVPVSTLVITFCLSLHVQGSFQLHFVVMENDTELTNDTFIDNFVANVVLSVSDTFAGPVMIISENMRFTVELSFRVTCQQDFHDSNCATFCLARNDTLGHYNCNTLTGILSACLGTRMCQLLVQSVSI